MGSASTMGINLSIGPTFEEVLKSWGVPAAVVGVFVVLVAAPKILEGIRSIWKAFADFFGLFASVFFSPAKRAEAEMRRRIAKTLLQNLNLSELLIGWDDERFIETRASIESLDSPRRSHSYMNPFRSRAVVYRTKSLSDAFARTPATLINLQGMPGSGKSVALRRFARETLERAQRSKHPTTLLAFYVNLRDFEAQEGVLSEASLEKYIHEQLNPNQAGELTTYFTNGFRRDLSAGRCILLFDSFDEIPGIVGAANIDRAVLPYVQMISNFASGGNSKCIIASREYKGPRVPGWIRLELVPLTFAEQVQLLRNWGLTDSVINRFETSLTDPSTSLGSDLRNPLELALFARFVAQHDAAPARPSELFEALVKHQLGDASAQLDEPTSDLLPIAQRLAFDAIQRTSNGLRLTENDTFRAISEIAKRCSDPESSVQLIDSLVACRLLVRTSKNRSGERTLAFAHRRVMEFLATQYFISNPSVIDIEDLAFGNQWRETAVTILQVQDDERTTELLRKVDTWLVESYRQALKREQTNIPFEWDGRSIHVLEMLVAAFGSNPRKLPTQVRTSTTQLLKLAWTSGGISERKFALDCIVLAIEDECLEYINRAFSGTSLWLRLATLRRCSQLNPLPHSVENSILRLLVTLMSGGRIRQDSRVLDSDLRRLYNGHQMVRARRMLTIIPFLLPLFCILAVATHYVANGYDVANTGTLRTELIVYVLLPVALFWVYQSTEPLSYRTSTRSGRIISRVARRLFTWGNENQSEVMWVIICLIVAFQFLIFTILAIIDAFTLGPSSGIKHFIVYGATVAYTVFWPCATTSAIRFDSSSRPMTWVAFFLTPWTKLRSIFTEILDIGILGTIRIFLETLLYQAIVIGSIVGVFYVLSTYGGSVGNTIRTGLTYVLIGFIPVLVCWVVLRETLSRRKVMRRVRRGNLNFEVLLSNMIELGDPVEVVDYVRELRYVRTGDTRRIPRELVQSLIHSIEAATDAINSDSPTPESNVTAVSDRSIVGALEEVRIAAELLNQPRHIIANSAGRTIPVKNRVLTSWSGEVLDELGRLSEFLRER
jgi:NACHT domain